MNQYVPALASLLDELQRLSDRSDDKAKTARQDVWSRIAAVLGRPAADLALELGRTLEVQPITTRRWISGEYAPRQMHLMHLRSHWGLVPKQEGRAVGLAPVADAPVAFDGGYAALRTMNHLLFCLERASGMVFLKGMQAFRIGRSQQVREQMVNILEKNRELVLYYLFRKESAAARSLEGFYARQYVKESGVASRVHGIPMSETEDWLGLGTSPASPFVIRYGQSGIKEFRREIDVWYEVPVQELDERNQVIDIYGKAKSVFIQLPEEEALKAWHEWRSKVRTLLEQNNIVFPEELFS
jgi:hypothetical protein